MRNTQAPFPGLYKKQSSSLKVVLRTLSILLLLLITAIGIFLYLTRSTPDKTLKTFCSALQQGNYATSYQQLSLTLQRAFSEPAFARTFAHDTVSNCTYTTINAGLSTAQTKLSIRHKSKKDNIDQVALIKDEQHVWKINAVQSARSQPLPQKASVYHLTLSAHQLLRDPAAIFASGGADTGIAVFPSERVVLFLSGSDHLSAKNTVAGPSGSSSCSPATMPEPALPCYSVIYSSGLTSPAVEIGTHADFTTTTVGSIFLGMNIPEQTAASGTFQVTLLTIPSGMATGLWQTPTNGFFVQGQHLSLSMQLFSQNDQISSVRFFLLDLQGNSSGICTIPYNGTDLVTCDWNLTLGSNNDPQHDPPITNGPLKLGFSIQSEKSLVIDPDGIRSGIARYVATQASENYAGYAAAAANPNLLVHYQQTRMQWRVPQVTCTRNENSDMAVWAGLTGNPNNSELAQTGTMSGCEAGVPIFLAWWEIYPAPSHSINYPIQPGDSIISQVTYKQGIFLLTLDDISQHWHFSTQQGGSDNDTITALCVIEAPFDTVKNGLDPLSNFGSITTSCRVNNQPLGTVGPQNVVYQMLGPQQHAITSSLDPQGLTFTVQWQKQSMP